MKLKYKLPRIKKLDIDIDLPTLQAECDKFANNFVDVRTANPNLCMNHEDLVKSVYDNFEQINLTMPSETMEFTSDVKERIRRKEESLYNVPTDEYKGSYFEHIVNQFKAPAMRVRITKLAPGKEIPFHIDYDPSYAARCIVPIYTNKDVFNYFKVKGVVENYNLWAGSAYFLNTGFAHAVKNNSDQPRIALMFSLDGIEDVDS